ncbi:MAG: hypothetical protein AAGD38_16335 [Acidobacteriota bacterium]
MIANRSLPFFLTRSDRVDGRRVLGVLVFASVLALAVSGCGVRDAGAATTAEAPTHELVTLSPVYTVDRLYRSMTGPYDTTELHLAEADAKPEIYWITGYRAIMVGPDGETPMPQDFMCHSNLDIDPRRHRASLPASQGFSSRLFTLSQGQLDIDFPAGFGIPVVSTEALSLTTQVLNLNLEETNTEVRHKVTLKYQKQSELGGPLVPLFPIGAYGLRALEGSSHHYGVDRADDEAHGPGCLPGESASAHDYTDQHGNVFTGHWVVEPGREVNHTLVTNLMQVPYDTTIHYIAVHLHPFAESLTLIDRTTGETLFEAKAKGFDDRIGLSTVDSLSSVEGIPVYRGHEYELVSVYDNPTDEAQDAMAVMYIYLRDQRLQARMQAGIDLGAATR